MTDPREGTGHNRGQSDSSEEADREAGSWAGRSVEGRSCRQGWGPPLRTKALWGKQDTLRRRETSSVIFGTPGLSDSGRLTFSVGFLILQAFSAYCRWRWASVSPNQNIVLIKQKVRRLNGHVIH